MKYFITYHRCWAIAALEVNQWLSCISWSCVWWNHITFAIIYSLFHGCEKSQLRSIVILPFDRNVCLVLSINLVHNSIADHGLGVQPWIDNSNFHTHYNGRSIGKWIVNWPRNSCSVRTWWHWETHECFITFNDVLLKHERSNPYFVVKVESMMRSWTAASMASVKSLETVQAPLTRVMWNKTTRIHDTRKVECMFFLLSECRRPDWTP